MKIVPRGSLSGLRFANLEQNRISKCPKDDQMKSMQQLRGAAVPQGHGGEMIQVRRLAELIGEYGLVKWSKFAG